MKILRMTERGKIRFMSILDSVKAGESPDLLHELLSPSEYAEAIGGDASWLDNLDLENSLEAAKGLDQIVSELELASAERDWGFWSWCSAYLFERLCKRESSGKFKPGEMPIWIAEPYNWKRYYRHYLASIWQVYSAHRNKEQELVVLLNGPVNTPGELWAQIAATQTLITNESMIDTVHHLYWDKTNFCRKRGAGGNSPRRLTTVLRQFERTFDFFAMSSDQIVNLLPSEFDRFKELSVTQ